MTYGIDTGDAVGPFTLDVELLFQSTSHRWAQNTSAYDTEQALLISAYYNTLPNLPVVVAAQSVENKWTILSTHQPEVGMFCWVFQVRAAQHRLQRAAATPHANRVRFASHVGRKRRSFARTAAAAEPHH